MFSVFGGTEARRLPTPAGHSPWVGRDRILTALAVVLVAVVATGAIALAVSLLPSAPAQPAQTGVSIGSAPSVDTQQTAPEVVAPAVPAVVDYRVVWTEVKDFNPSAIPVEGGIYNANYSWIDKEGYGKKILPYLKGLPVAVAATRDEHNKDVVLASLDADRYGPYLLLSVDGEKSWCRLNLIPITWEGQATNGVTPEEVRVVAEEEEIRLYGRYALGAGPNHLYWWGTIVNKSKLPCS